VLYAKRLKSHDIFKNKYNRDMIKNSFLIIRKKRKLTLKNLEKHIKNIKIKTKFIVFVIALEKSKLTQQYLQEILRIHDLLYTQHGKFGYR